MPFSFQSDFNLRFAGEEAKDFIGNAVRTWPALWERIPGVTGTLLLSNSFALGGAFEYRWRVDLEKVATLSAIGDALSSDDSGWTRLMSRWFDARTAVRARVMQHVGGSDRYCSTANEDDALIHLIVRHEGHDKEASAAQHETLSKANQVRAFQAQRTVLTAGSSSAESWLRLGSLGDVEEFTASRPEIGRTQLYQEVREIDGALIVGA